MAEKRTWAADTPISAPEPIDSTNQPVLVDFGGIAFTSGGLAHNVADGDIDNIFFPAYAPEGYRGGN